MRILWLSNPPWTGTGYGEQTNLFVPRLQALGHEVAVAANFGLNGVTLQWDGLDVYPSDNAWGSEALGIYAEAHRADVVIALCDAWVLNPDEWPEIPTAIWAPIDHYPIPPAVLARLGHEKIRPIAMSRFGERAMSDFKLDPLYVPHGVDTALFRPTPEIRDAVREELGVPREAFLVGMVAANKGNPANPRKAFGQAFQALAKVMGERPDVWAYVHAEATPAKANGGLDLEVLARACAIPADRILFPGPKAWRLGIPRETVAAVYQALDVTLLPSKGEGFGIPLLEAQAAGCPVITSRHSAMIELGETAGWLVDGQPEWDGLQTAWLFDPFVHSIVEKLEEAYAERGTTARREAAVEFAQTYDADRVTADHWRPALASLVSPPVESRQVRRARERREAKSKAVA